MCVCVFTAEQRDINVYKNSVELVIMCDAKKKICAPQFKLSTLLRWERERTRNFCIRFMKHSHSLFVFVAWKKIQMKIFFLSRKKWARAFLVSFSPRLLFSLLLFISTRKTHRAKEIEREREKERELCVSVMLSSFNFKLLFILSLWLYYFIHLKPEMGVKGV